MKKIILIFFALVVCTSAQSNDEYYCLISEKKSILLVSSKYPDINFVKYHPYLKNIKISRPIKERNVDMCDNAKSEVYRTMNEINNGKITVYYTFMSQSYLLYDVEYKNLKTKKTNIFNKSNIHIDNINFL